MKLSTLIVRTFVVIALFTFAHNVLAAGPMMPVPTPPGPTFAGPMMPVPTPPGPIPPLIWPAESGTVNMWLRKTEKSGPPEKTRYSRYYEHDGALRAYANRAMALAFLCVPTTMLALGFAVYVRLQPPTVVRISDDGQATVIGKATPSVTVSDRERSGPTELERRALSAVISGSVSRILSGQREPQLGRQSQHDDRQPAAYCLCRNAEGQFDWKSTGRRNYLGVPAPFPRGFER